MTLETDIEALRERVFDTQELYREVCTLLFFRYGETPTANKLYQLVRKGSMSAPAKALRDFWIDVRDKTRVDVGQPDLPSEVATAAGDMVARLWQVAREAAQLGLQSFQQDAQHEVDTARQTVEAMTRQRDAALEVAREAAESMTAEKQRTADLEAHLVREQAANTMLREELARARNEAATAATALADARRDFSNELEKLRISLAQNEQRLVAAEKRALMEIEGERASAARARKDLTAANERLAGAETAHRAERDGLRDELATLKAQLAASQEQSGRLQKLLDGRQDELVNQRLEIDSLEQALRLASVRRDARRTKASVSDEPPRQRQTVSRKARGRVEFSVGPINRRSTENT